ncbi:helix-turn-helix domain-containing protein [Streptomyces sp. NPDC059524]|uniref:helix-turn-helix domain-containing protein n=1 Tax=Streptomyces sp. NPDC059524 TaxID=3346856 RepID=UPI0036CC0218
MEEQVSGGTGAGAVDAADGFAELLSALKDRSGLSYGTLAKRLHMSTSTLHRYCNGTAVPTDYAPVERLARVCKATPEELVELHRRWILADANRGSGSRKASPSSAPVPAPTPAEASAPSPEPVPDEPRPRRRTALIAALTVAAVLGTTVLGVSLFRRGGDDSDRQQAAGVRQSTAPSAATSVSASPPPSTTDRRENDKIDGKDKDGDGDKDKNRDKGGAAETGATESGGGHATGTPFTVGTRPYVYDQPCSQHFLVDSEPAQVGPPANEETAAKWASAYGAVSGGEQRVALTLQGTGADTVVLEALHVTIAGKSAPLAWNDYAMGVGCGGGVDTKSFDVPLDAGSPTVSGINGQRDFPYKVSESDPEVFYITAHTKAHDVRWYLTLDWSSGSRHGTVRIDDHGTPFRTSANEGRPGYDYPLGGSDWIERVEQQ